MRRLSYLELCAVACIPGNDVPRVDTYLLSYVIYNIYLLSIHNISYILQPHLAASTLGGCMKCWCRWSTHSTTRCSVVPVRAM